MTHSKEINTMKKITAVALVLGVLVLAGFSVDNQSPKKAPQTVSVANDYGSFTQYMQ
jgi:ABC-type antimicrobial peptide transport system permease subunit